MTNRNNHRQLAACAMRPGAPSGCNWRAELLRRAWRGARRGAWMGLLGCGLLVAGCDLAQMARTWDRYPSQIDTLAGRPKARDPQVQSQGRGLAIYQHYCLVCHGEQGKGDGFNSAMLKPPPRNFADMNFWSQSSDEKLAKTIGEGGASTGLSNLMPAWGRTLDAQQIHDVINYLHTLPSTSSPDGEQSASNAPQ